MTPKPIAVLLGILLLGILLVAACAGGEDPVCNADADCASGRCLPDRTCAPRVEPDGGAPLPPDGGGPPVDDAGAAPDGGFSDAGPVACAPDHDGTITRLEVPLEAGLRATFRAATDARFDTSGEPLAGGERRWDLSGALAGDHDVLIDLTPVESHWFADAFPGATYAARLSDGDDLLGVFEITGSELLLRGVASPTEDFGYTRVDHDPPVSVLRFPLSMGQRWSTHTTVSGVSLGVPALWTEDYAYEVDARGELLTPFGTFPVLRVRITLTRTVGLFTTIVRSFAFVAECFGTVATVTSQDDEPREEFSTAAELRRLAP